MAVDRIGLVNELDQADWPTRHNRRELKLARDVLGNKNIDDAFQSAPVISTAVGSGAAPSEAAAAAVLAFSTGQALYELYYAAVETTGTAAYKFPTVSADGLELPLDANVTDGPTGIEITNGTTARSRAAFVIGTDEDFFLETAVTIGVVSNLTSMFVGFRKVEAYQANPETYTDFAAFQIGGTADGQINIWSALNDAATTKTDTTLTDWVDDVSGTGTHTLRVTVRKSGLVEFAFDGAEPTVTQRYVFDSGDTVIPFLHVTNETGDPGISLDSWRCGRL